jgi:hypothetical protein
MHLLIVSAGARELLVVAVSYPSLKSSLQKLYGRDHEQVDRKFQYL